MSVETALPTIVLHHASAESYARLIARQFPRLRIIVASDPEQLERCIEQADVLLTSNFPVDLFDRAKRLRWVQFTTAGVDSIIAIVEKAKGIIVTNARGIHGELIADYVLAGITMLLWDFRRIFQEQAERNWNPRYVAPLASKTLGIVGLGSIGATLAKRAKGAGMTVFGTKKDTMAIVQYVDKVFASDALHEMLPHCDFVVLAVPATAETNGLMGATEISLMRRDAFLINIARGKVVVESELINALQAGTIAGAMLDVFEEEPLPKNSPLWGMPNVLATPHVAGGATDYTERVLSIFADNLERFMLGEELRNVVDLSRGY